MSKSFRPMVATAIAAATFVVSAAVKETQLDVVDVLIAFDASAQNWLLVEGRGSIGQYATNCIDKLNYCLEQSQISEFRFRLAGFVAVNEDCSGADFAALLQKRIVNGYGEVVAQGELKKITDAREAVGADIVSFLVGSGISGNTGMGYELKGMGLSAIPSFGNWAYNICSIQSADRSYTQVHEIAHNMGCGHPDKTLFSTPYASPGPQLFKYSAGYYLWSNGIGYYTIMGYNFGGIGPDGTFASAAGGFEPLPFFSSPQLSYEGVVLGDAAHDNRRTLLETYRYVAQYRASRISSEDGPGPTPIPEGAKFMAKTTVNAAVLDSAGSLCGIFQATIAKTDKKYCSKITGSYIGLDGKAKKGTIKSMPVISDEGVASVRKAVLEIKNEAVLTFDADETGSISGTFSDGRTLVRCSSVGKMDNLISRFAVGGELAKIPDLLTDVESEGATYRLVPDGDGVSFKSGAKWAFDKNATVKYRKNKETKIQELFVDTKNGTKSNLCSLKLSCNSKTGVMKGSFLLYGKAGTEVKPKLAKYKFSVSGVVCDGEGAGIAICKKPYIELPIKVK